MASWANSWMLDSRKGALVTVPILALVLLTGGNHGIEGVSAAKAEELK